MAKKKYYAVKKGVQPGIYSSWSMAEAQVKGFSGAQFKGFVNEVDARAWLEHGYLVTEKVECGLAQPVVAKGHVVVYTDGGAMNNPGPGGYGVVIVTSSATQEFSGGYASTTNNRMELMACIVALRELEGCDAHITIHSDSTYVVNGIMKGWAQNWRKNNWRKADNKPVLNKDLWAVLLRRSESLDVKFKWVKGHAGNLLNEKCDKLAVQAAKGKDLKTDTGYCQN